VPFIQLVDLGERMRRLIAESYLDLADAGIRTTLG